MTPAVLAILSFLLACVLFLGGRILAKRIGLIDKPGGRKLHADSVPLIGGLVIVPVFIMASILGGLQDSYWPLMAASGFLLILGAIDDAFPLNPYFKFALQMLTACFVVVFGELQVDTLGNLFGFGEVELGFIAKPFTVMAFVLFMNSLNMIDGLDGLAGGLSAVMLGILLLVATIGNAATEMQAIMFLLAPLLAFLIFNMRYPGHKKASVFLGDAGSLALGLLIAWFAIDLTQKPNDLLSPSLVPWIIGVPVIDAFSLYIMRTMTGQKPFEADRNHIHHRLLDCGIVPGKVTVLILLFKIITSLGAIGLYVAGVPECVIFGIWAILFFGHMAMIFRPQRYAAWLKWFA